MTTIFWRRGLSYGALLVLAFVALGYLSNVLSMNACRRATDVWMSENLAQHPSNWPDRGATSQPTKFVWPWIAGVEYWWSVGPTGGEGGTRFYFCLFGKAIPYGHRVEIQS
jgi:hypothetical protein